MSDNYHPDMDESIQRVVHDELASFAALLNGLGTGSVRGVLSAVLYDDEDNIHTHYCAAMCDEDDRSNAIIGLLDITTNVAKADI